MLDAKETNGIVVLQLKDTDRFNALISEAVKEQLLEYFTKPNARVLFCLDGIRFIDSSGFSVFLSAMKHANNNFGQFRISNVSREVKELFQVLQLHNVFDLYESVDEALAEFN